MFHMFTQCASFPRESFGPPQAENFADPVGRHEPQTDFATALEDCVDGKVALEDEIAAVLDLGDGVESPQVDPLTFFFRELRSDDESPVIELLADVGGV